jgi:hypothetical protein
MAVGDDSALALVGATGAPVDWGGGTCTGNFKAAWLSPSKGIVYVASEEAVLEVRGPGTCEPVARFPFADVTSLAGLELVDGGLRLFIGASAAPWLLEGLPDGGASAARVSVSGPVHDLAAVDVGATWAVGSENGHAAFWRLDSQADEWVFQGSGAPGTLYAVDLVSAGEGFAGGGLGSNGVSYGRAAGVWAAASAPGFVVRGVAMRDQTNVTAVGDPQAGQLGFARWDGSAWQLVPGSASVEKLRRVRSAGGCDVWAVGENGLVVTTRP